MIVEAGLAKAIAAGGGLISGIALVAGMAGGGQYVAVQSAPSKVPSAACAYAGGSHRSGVASALALRADQMANARVIVETAQELGLPRRAAVIGVATALQESSLDNRVVGDDGQAFGIFQQHPRHGWGSRAQVINPRHAARTFFSRLVKVKNWDTKPLTVAAQTVQRSAFPNAYAKHERRAERIVDAVRSQTAVSPTVNLSAEDTRVVRAGLESAIALGIPRAEVIADVATGIRTGTLPSARRRDGNDPDKLAERIIAGVAAHLCTELSRVTAGPVLADAGRGVLALKAALKMLGVPFSWGGGGPGGPSYGIGRGARTKGFDCSGLTEYAWSKAGVKIGGHTSTQWRAGTRVPRSQLKPGDLIFFATNPRNPATIHHVVLNIDGRRYVHAPRTGSVVRIDTWTPGREAQYAGAVRPG